MNILYISNLSGNLFAGPNNSVPAQIKAQSKIDNVFWYNINHVKRPEWIEIGCNNLSDFPNADLKGLPSPFSKPDIVVVEEFYCYPFCKIIEDIIKLKIPFIIIPRSEFTWQGQRKKLIKKKIANIIYFNRFARKASAIQYLSEQERTDSGDKWNKKSIIISNGVNMPLVHKSQFSTKGIQAVYIGRYDIYQKGLDLLLNSVALIKDELREAKFKLNMYGVDQSGARKYINSQVKKYNIEELIVINDTIFGEDKREVLLSSDVFILTSRFEGMPMGLIEALSYGIPCLVTSGTNMSNEIEKYSAGWTAEITIDSITMAIEKMLADTYCFDVKGVNARKLAENYSWSEVAKKSSQLYDDLLKGNI